MQRCMCWLGLIVLLVGCKPAASPPKPASPVAAGSTTGPATAEIPSQAETTPQESYDGKSPILDPVNETPASTSSTGLSPAEIADGWLQLFDGDSLFGWKPNSEMNWRVEDGVIMADEGKPGLLQSTSRFADYELRCDFRVEQGGNSGIFLRSAFIPADPAVDCYELNMCDSHPAFKSGSIVKRAQPSKEITADGAWHTFHVRLEGPRMIVKFDGEQILDFTDETATPLTIGHIGLQMNGGKAEFKNVYVKPLGSQPLSDGESLNGWRVVPGSKSHFEVEDGTIHVSGKLPDGQPGERGFLETEATAKNFVLQFQAKTNGDKLNSGVFFRAMPGTEKAPSNGYEFQIQNGFKDDDRTKPDDFGTGAIFRRVAARKVVSNDREWFTATLIADGPHFATWVNGYPVVDWTDEREPNDNPREGLKLDAGHFSLQGHDPGTDLNFRKLSLIRLPD